MHLELLPSLLLLLVFARLLGRAFTSLGMHEIVGEILAGLLLGPIVFNLVQSTAELSGIVQLAVLLIFGAGLEVDLSEVLNALKKNALLAAAIGFMFPLAAGFFAGRYFGLEPIPSASIGLCLAITSLPVSLKMLSIFDLQDTSIGHTTIGAAIIIDIITLLLLGVIIDTPKDASSQEMIQTTLKTCGSLAVFFAITLGANYLLRNNFLMVARTKKLYQKAVDTFGDEGIFGMSLLFVLGFSTISEILGLHFVIGAFFGGLLLNKDIMGSVFFKKLDSTLDSVSNGFLTPIFFASIGMQLSVSAFERLDILAIILIAGFVTKFAGSWLGARIAGINPRESVALGLFLNSRGVLDLVVAEIALQKGHISSTIFSALVLLSILSNILIPFLYARVGEKTPSPAPAT